jgi:hypothetical protein
MMKDLIGFLLALLFAGHGVFIYVRPERLIKDNSDQRELKIKRLKIIGILQFVIGILLLGVIVAKY